MARDRTEQVAESDVIRLLPPSVRHVIGSLDEASRCAFIQEFVIRTRYRSLLPLPPVVTRVVNEWRARRILRTLHLGPDIASTRVDTDSCEHADGGLEPISQQRLEAYMKDHGYSYQVDKDGDLTGVWENCQFWFIRVGEQREVLIVRGIKPLADTPVTPKLLSVLNDLNCRFTLPKSYIQTSEQLPHPVMVTDITVDFEKGAAAEQLHFMLDSAIATINKYYETLSETLEDMSGPGAPQENSATTGFYL